MPGRAARGHAIEVVFCVSSYRRLRARPFGTRRAAVREAIGRTHDVLVPGKRRLPFEQKLFVWRLATNIAVLPEKEATHALPLRGGLDQQKYMGRIGKVGKNGELVALFQVQSRPGMAAPVADDVQTTGLRSSPSFLPALIYLASTGIVVTAPVGVARRPSTLICAPTGLSNSTVPRLPATDA